jgi:uncharacterized membrane protein HdeD (DUF308 family)
MGMGTKLDDFLEPLRQGVWEVVLQKETVTESLDSGWVQSKINVPSPGTIACYRKARFHVHETKTQWRVHLDRYDPKVNPLLHLADDAPLLLMISDTFMTLLMNTRRTEIKNTADILKTQRFIWQEQVFSGLISGLVGLFIVLHPFIFFKNIINLIIPLAILCLAVIVLVRAVRAGLPEKHRNRDLSRGLGIFCAGIFAYILPLALWVIFILVILALWMIASAGMLLVRVAKGRHAVPEGMYSRMAIGIVSLVLAVLLFLSPAHILGLLIMILGAVTILLGITLCINALQLRSAMQQISTG